MKSIRVILALACIGLFTTSVVSEDAFARREGGGKGRKGMKKGGGKRAARKQAYGRISQVSVRAWSKAEAADVLLRQNEASQSAECSAGLTKANMPHWTLRPATTGTNAGWPSADETAVDPAAAVRLQTTNSSHKKNSYQASLRRGPARIPASVSGGAGRFFFGMQ